jgi:cytidine deaminase
MERYGIVFISRGFSYDRSHREFIGHWESSGHEGSTIVEDGPGWDDVEDAIAWGRARAPRVMVRLGASEDTIYSAGETKLMRFSDGTGEPYPAWTPLV